MTILAGCQSLPPEPGSGQGSAEVGAKELGQVPAKMSPAASTQARALASKQSAAKAGPEAPPDDLWERLRSEMTWQQLDNPQVGAARDHFLAQPTYLDVIAERSSLYLYYILDQVESRGMPPEIALLPLVESTMDPFARSPNHAAGLWQIMPATGRHLGLTSNWWYDGRQDLRESTRVALDYLQSLNKEFEGDWLLTLAAYNSGNGRVGRAIARNEKRGKPTDYWSLNLPRETRNYVPRVAALASLITDPERYSVTLPPVPNRPAFAAAPTGGQIELARAAELAGVDESLLRALNPGQLRWATAPGQTHELLLPMEVVDQFEQGIASLPREERVSWRHYTIRSGDSLSRIAHRFDTSVAMLKEVNKLRGSLIRSGQTLLIPQDGTWTGSLAMAGGGGARSHDYQVKHGDSLYRIAGRFNVSIEDIVSWNSLDPGAYLQPGQQLTLFLSGGG